mgnify:CR=1 FL=1
MRLGRRELRVFFLGKHSAIKGRNVLLREKKNSGLLKRFAFMVSGPKKSAAARNLTRRRLYEIIRAEASVIPPGWDLVFSTKLSQKKAIGFLELKEDLKNVLHKADL